MKKLLVLIIILFAVATYGFSQMPSAFEAVSKYYKVYSEKSTKDAQDTAQMMDAFFDLYNTYFHFDSGKLKDKLNVKIFKDKDSYDSYLMAIIGETKDSFVYLQYSDLKKSELVGYQLDSDDFNTTLIRHGFIQFLKSFVKSPPLWIQRGFAIFFENSTYDPDNNLAIFRENLSWLSMLKKIIQNSIDSKDGAGKVLIPLPSLLNPDNITADNQQDVFYAESWGFITFLQGSDKKQHNRLLWDSIRLMTSEGTLEGNEQVIKKTALTWSNEHLLFSDFITYINNLKTFPDLVKDGIQLYSQGDTDASEKSFIQAIVLDANNSLPYYYLGLIHYSRKDYSLAEYYYQSALNLGSKPGLIYYALALNAFADNKLEEAVKYLKESAKADPDTYTSKTEKLLNRIEKMTLSVSP